MNQRISDILTVLGSYALRNDTLRRDLDEALEELSEMKDEVERLKTVAKHKDNQVGELENENRKIIEQLKDSTKTIQVLQSSLTHRL